MRKIEMFIDRDEFAVTYDPRKLDPAQLIAVIKKTGYTARVVSGKGKSPAAETNLVPLPRGMALLDEALATAKREKKPIVIDFFAEWCAPCLRMEKTTFTDNKVTALLERVVFIRVDTDKHPDIARRMKVDGLPDIRFVLPDGKVVRRLRNYQDAESFTAELERLLQSVEEKLRR